MNRIVFKNVNVITPERILKNNAVIIEDGVIQEICNTDLLPKNISAQIIDGQGLYLSAGFIDIHTHGGGGFDFMDGTVEAFHGACEMHASHGTTALLPTALSGDTKELKSFFEAYHESLKQNYNGSQMLGVHLEGPYFSDEYSGAQDKKYLCNPQPAHYQQILDWSKGSIVRWSAAPELNGSEEFAFFLRKNNILASIAHTSATYEEVLKAYDNGFCLITHLYSGMSSIVRKKGFRISGVVESAYLIDGMAVEVIADGCHLPAELIYLAYKIKGAEKMALVTDSMRGAGMPDGESILGSKTLGQKVYIEKGVAFMPDREAFAGSVCTTDRLVRTVVKNTPITLNEAVRMVTQTPAKMIGCARNKGTISVGRDADIVLFDDDINVAITMIKGRIVFAKKEF